METRLLRRPKKTKGSAIHSAHSKRQEKEASTLTGQESQGQMGLHAGRIQWLKAPQEQKIFRKPEYRLRPLNARELPGMGPAPEPPVPGFQLYPRWITRIRQPGLAVWERGMLWPVECGDADPLTHTQGQILRRLGTRQTVPSHMYSTIMEKKTALIKT